MSVPQGQISNWVEWKRADAHMVTLVKAALRVEQAAQTEDDFSKAGDSYDKLLETWARLKSVGLHVVDQQIAKTGLVDEVEMLNAAIGKEADRIAALAKSIDDVAKFAAEIAKVLGQFDLLLDAFGKLKL